MKDAHLNGILLISGLFPLAIGAGIPKSTIFYTMAHYSLVALGGFISGVGIGGFLK